MVFPGAGYGGYVRLSEILEKGLLQAGKVVFEYIKDKGDVYANGRLLQGLKIVDAYAHITGVHYTAWEFATQIRSMMRIEPSLNDPFVYISEPGMMAGWPEELIKKEVGASAADTEVRLTVIVPVGVVWIKASRDVAHYAIAGILSKNEIIRLDIQRRKTS